MPWRWIKVIGIVIIVENLDIQQGIVGIEQNRTELEKEGD